MKLKRGFTIVEAMIVVVIVSLPVAIAIPNLITAREQAQKLQGVYRPVEEGGGSMRIFVLFEAIMVLFFLWCIINLVYYVIAKVTGYGVEGGGLFALAKWMAQGEKKRYQKDKEERDRRY